MATLTAIVTFIASPLGRWLAGAIGVVVVLLVVYNKGHDAGYTRAMAKVEAQQAKAIKLANKARDQLFKACARDSAACVPIDWFREDDE